jgi:hypothetical protein
MKDILYALSIGSGDSCDGVRDVLLKRGHCHLTVAAGYDELIALRRQEGCGLAILHEPLPRRELLASCGYIRRTWPGARILLISNNAEALDDPMYDDRLAPGHSTDELLKTIESLTARWNGQPGVPYR